MAKKPGPKKGAKQRPRSAAQKRSPAEGKAAPKKARPQKRAAEADRSNTERSTGAKVAALARSTPVRGALAATLVSAAGALLFWRRRDKSGDEQDTSVAPPSAAASRSSKPGGAGKRAASGRSAGDTSPLVAAGVAGGAGKRRSAGAKAKPRGRKTAPETSAASAEPSDPAQAEPGAYPDGSPSGDMAGRTSIEGGNDRTA
jgi:hypothetical protein